MSNIVKIKASEEKTLLEILLEKGEFVDNPCNGMGTCGKCKVKILKGETSPLTPEEQKRLKVQEIEESVRLSCMTYAKSDLTVELLQKQLQHKVLTTGKMPEFERDENLEGYGFAIDIGTTTVVASLVDLSTGEELASTSDINAQLEWYPTSQLSQRGRSPGHLPACVQDKLIYVGNSSKTGAYMTLLSEKVMIAAMVFK